MLKDIEIYKGSKYYTRNSIIDLIRDTLFDNLNIEIYIDDDDDIIINELVDKFIAYNDLIVIPDDDQILNFIYEYGNMKEVVKYFSHDEIEEWALKMYSSISNNDYLMINFEYDEYNNYPKVVKQFVELVTK